MTCSPSFAGVPEGPNIESAQAASAAPATAARTAGLGPGRGRVPTGGADEGGTHGGAAVRGDRRRHGEAKPACEHLGIHPPGRTTSLFSLPGSLQTDQRRAARKTGSWVRWRNLCVTDIVRLTHGPVT